MKNLRYIGTSPIVVTSYGVVWPNSTVTVDENAPEISANPTLFVQPEDTRDVTFSSGLNPSPAQQAQAQRNIGLNNIGNGIVLIGSSTFGFDSTSDQLTTNAVGPITNGIALSGARARVIANLSVGSTGINEMEQQFVAAMALNPAIIIAQAFSNDIITGMTAESVWPRFVALIDKCKNSRTKLILRMTHPRGGTASQNKDYMKLRSWAYKAAREYANFMILDAWAIYIDPTSSTGALKANVSNDGTHPNNYGAFLEGVAWADLFTSILPPLPYPLPDAFDVSGAGVQYLPNTIFSGSGGTGNGNTTGTIPAGWSFYPSGSATMVSSVTTTNGRGVLRGALTGAAQGDYLRLSTTVNLTAGTWIMGCRVKAVDGPNLGVPRLSLFGSAATVAVMQRDNTLSNIKPIGASGHTYTLVSAPFTLTTSEAPTYLLTIYLGASGGMTVDIDSPFVIKVD